MYKLSDFDKSSENLYKIGKIFSRFICSIIIFLLIFNIILIIKSYVNPNELPSFLGIKSFVIASESMEPTIKTNDVIFIKDINKENLEINDIISFKMGDYIITHRIIGIEEDNGEKTYITKGDNNEKEDKEKIKNQEIEGKYLFKIPGFGKVIKILKNKITLIVLLTFLVLISYYEVRISRRRLQRKEERYEYNKRLLNKLKENIK